VKKTGHEEVGAEVKPAKVKKSKKVTAELQGEAKDQPDADAPSTEEDAPEATETEIDATTTED
jgi:hypothetical protein